MATYPNITIENSSRLNVINNREIEFSQSGVVHGQEHMPADRRQGGYVVMDIKHRNVSATDLGTLLAFYKAELDNDTTLVWSDTETYIGRIMEWDHTDLGFGLWDVNCRMVGVQQ